MITKIFFFHIIILTSLLVSCSSLNKNHQDDYYAVINSKLDTNYKNFDSVYVFIRNSDPLFKQEKRESIFLNMMDVLDERSKNDIQSFLKTQGNIDLDKEIRNFQKQLTKYESIKPDKILKKNIIYLSWPKNKKDSLRYAKSKYTLNTISLANPLFTKNGKYALVDDVGDRGYYLVIYKKNGKSWVEKSRHLYFLR